MNNRTQELLQRAKQAQVRSEATLKRTAPRATLGGIKSAAEKKFGQRKQKQKPVQQKPKRTKTKQQRSQKQKAAPSDKLTQWKQAMEKANIPKHRWRKLEDKISKLSGTQRQEIEEELFEHRMFEAVYSVGEDDPSIVDDYLSDLEAKLDEATFDLFSDDVLNEIKEFALESPEKATLIANVTKTQIDNRNMAKEIQAALPDTYRSLMNLSAAQKNLPEYESRQMELLHTERSANPNMISITSSAGVSFKFDLNTKLSELSDDEFEDWLQELESLGIFK